MNRLSSGVGWKRKISEGNIILFHVRSNNVLNIFHNRSSQSLKEAAFSFLLTGSITYQPAAFFLRYNPIQKKSSHSVLLLPSHDLYGLIHGLLAIPLMAPCLFYSTKNKSSFWSTLLLLLSLASTISKPGPRWFFQFSHIIYLFYRSSSFGPLQKR